MHQFPAVEKRKHQEEDGEEGLDQSSEGNLIGEDLPNDPYLETQISSPFERHCESAPSSTALVQGTEDTTGKAINQSTEADRLADEERRRAIKTRLGGYLDDEWIQEFIETLTKFSRQLIALLRLYERESSRMEVDQLTNSGVFGKNDRGVGEFLHDGEKGAWCRASELIRRSRATGEEEEDSAAMAAPTLIVKLRLPSHRLGKRPLPEDEAEEGGAGMGEVADATSEIRASKSRKKSRQAGPPHLKLKFEG